MIDNDSFPVLLNAYQWRGRILRKRGTELLVRLTRYFNSASTSYGIISSFTLSSGAGNLLTAFSLQANGNIVPGSVTLTDFTASKTYTDDSMGNLVGSPSGTGTINYATGAITITGGGGDTINTVSFLYYPDLPVMGLEDWITTDMQYPGTIAFDTVYSYIITTAMPFSVYDVSFYKNPVTATYTGYTAKTTVTPLHWNGQDYQQFWTTNYQGALWATNGITFPFSPTNIGMQFKAITGVSITTATSANGPSTVTLTIVAHGLVVGDFVFINEVTYSVAPTAGTASINLQTGYVITVTDANTVVVEFPNAYLTGTPNNNGIAQYLTSSVPFPAKDCLRWFDGDPTNASPTNPVLNGHKGWVNFMPPISNSPFAIGDLGPMQYYLIGARMIVPFKDRLLFFGPVIQSSSTGPFYLSDTVIYSQNGTPYYTASFTGDPLSTATTFYPILTPTNQSATPDSYFGDVTGYGGYLSAGIDQDIQTIGVNEDVLIVGFDRLQTRFIYSGNDIVPFNFYIVNSELGSGSTFSTIILDQGVLSKSSRGYIMTSQTGAQRIDLEIPDQVFQTRLTNNGAQRVCAGRDFVNEWIYFSYPSNLFQLNNYPSQTLQYNYREQSWSVFNESYTTYGSFRRTAGYTWATLPFDNWMEWNTPWNAGDSTLLQPEVIAGNQQGFVLFRDTTTTGEEPSLYIQNISGYMVTSPSHCLNSGDFIIINNCLGTVGSYVNGQIFQVTVNAVNTFIINNPSITLPAGLTYIGSGTITRLYVPFIQTKQFPVSWASGRKTRLGAQQYLLSTTENGQITLYIYLSQNSASPYNFGPIIPSVNTVNNSLIYSTVLYTCPEGTNLGLTPANINLQMVTGMQQSQIWHRINTSLLGDTVQVAFTLSPEQMFDPTFSNQDSEIELHGFIIDVTGSQMLA
jgi:hypothetical protein